MNGQMVAVAAAAQEQFDVFRKERLKFAKLHRHEYPPFGLPPGALEAAASTGQEDFSAVPADLQRSDILALLDVPAPGSLLAQQRQPPTVAAAAVTNMPGFAAAPAAVAPGPGNSITCST